MEGTDWPGKNWCPDDPAILELLERGEVESCELVPSGSNYVFAVRLQTSTSATGLAIYKPERGEAPLWDYPSGTLYKREFVTYLVSEALGWRFVPPTVVRSGPHGIGTVQLFIDHDPQQTFFNLRDARGDDLKRIAVFDVLVNNGDRKGGHCLLGVDGRIWGIDHGLTFHTEYKLRTVIWDYAGESVPDYLLDDLRKLGRCLERNSALGERLQELLSRAEISALHLRVQRLISEACLPTIGYRRPVPWPLV